MSKVDSKPNHKSDLKPNPAPPPPKSPPNQMIRGGVVPEKPRGVIRREKRGDC